MSTDTGKLYLKNKLEEQVKSLEDYSLHDSIEYPGWTFLLPDVVKAYGICPFLNVYDTECIQRRITWLHSQSDEGATYVDVVNRITDDSRLENLQKQIAEIKHDLIHHVKSRVKTMELSDGFDYDKLLDNIRMRKETKSQNKKVKDTWNLTLKVLDGICQDYGIDFSKYVNIIYGYVLRYKAPPVNNKDPIFDTLIKDFTDTLSQWQAEKLLRENECGEAQAQLANLIKSSFNIDQMGRYFKKWSSLTQEKKEERIHSYCEWYTRKHQKPLGFADEMYTFILQKLATKEMRITDIKWDSKLGIIKDITLNTSGELEVAKRAPRVLKTRRNSRKKDTALFVGEKDTLLMQRLHRLLLYEILRGGSIPKETVLENVLADASLPVATGVIMDYLSTKYDEMNAVVKENRPPRE